MKAEILSTGDEVLLGDILDTNSNYLCRQLTQNGIWVSQMSTIGDDVGRISKSLVSIAARADFCLVTGGLGPTQDDVTAKACADAAGEDLLINAHALETMEAYFKLRGFELTKENEKQALLPASAGVLVNDQGTAPGFSMVINGCLFFFMPGVPAEMKAMFQSKVLPKLGKMTGNLGEIRIRRIMVFGLGESRVGGNLKGFDSRFPGIRLGFRARYPLIEVKLVAGNAAGFDSSLSDQLDRARKWVVSRLENKVISLDGLTLEQEVGRLLEMKNFTLAVAESCTGGLISNQITDVAGASDYFLFSAVTYSNSAKTNILKVSPKILDTHGAVHEQTALEMAKGARQAGGADWAVSTTGIAGPSGGTPDKPVGTVCIGIAGPGVESYKRFCLDFGTRGKNKLMFAATALEMLRRSLVKA